MVSMNLKEESLIIFVIAFIFVFSVNSITEYVTHKIVTVWVNFVVAVCFAVIIVFFDYFKSHTRKKTSYYDEIDHNVRIDGPKLMKEDKTSVFESKLDKTIGPRHKFHWRSGWGWFIIVGLILIILLILFKFIL